MLGGKIASAIVLAAFAVGSRGTSPQGAVESFLSHGNPGLQMPLVNEADVWALVKTKGAVVESQPFPYPVLVQMYGFGWQVVGWARHPCDLAARGIPADRRKLLEDGMKLAPDNASDCAHPVTRPDIGPATDVEAVRAITEGPVIPVVVVHGNYATAEWTAGGGGQEVFARTGHSWQMIMHAGGAFDSGSMIAAGVPKSDACALFELMYQMHDCH